jgi:hypothetical protein
MRQLGKALTVSGDGEFFAGFFFGVVMPLFLQGVVRSCAFLGWFFVVKTVVSCWFFMVIWVVVFRVSKNVTF